MFHPRTLAAGVLLAALVVVATSTPASAHDSLITSSPAPGERLDAAPSEVSLTFSDDVLTLGAVIIVADAEGRDWVVDEPTITQNTVTATLAPGLPIAGYELRWRVVSSDGHPISGLVPFTIGDGVPLERPAVDSQPEASESAAPPAQGQIPQEQDSPARLILLGIGGAVIALALAALIHLFRRRTRSRGDAARSNIDAL